MDFDEDRIYYSYQNLQSQTDPNNDDTTDQSGINNANIIDDDGEVDLRAVRRHFREFLRNYRQGSHRYIYRDRLLDMHRRTFGDDQPAQQGDPDDDLLNDLNNSTSINSTVFIGNTQLYPTIEVDLAHVGEYDTALLGLLQTRPATVLPVFETAAADALKSFFGAQQQQQRNQQPQDMNSMDVDATPTAQGELPGYTSIQILIKGNLKPTSLRSINASHMHKLLRCPGIVIQAARVHSRASRIRVRCSRCSHTVMLGGGSSTNSKSNLEGGPFSTISIPNNCLSQTPEECGPKPYAVIPDESQFVDQQTLKLQESPENVPTGEMPRSILLACERSLVDRAPPGTRVSIIAIASMFNSSSAAGQNNKSVYLRVVGMQRENAGDGSASGSDFTSFTKAEEEAFRLLSKRSDIYTILYKSIAPSISGSYTIDIKKAMTCMLFGGSRKKLPDKMRLRGDINVLLLGDPSTAKSQFLKFMQRVAPIAVYTSGKGSSAAGLTASVIKDPRGEFYLEGGAMVLADGGIVCIDEFDKMRPADRVAIHEAMEQQTISVAKAGITTVLNSRTAVLAAANPVYGRYDDLKSASENIDLMTTILSRFDMIFLVRDVRDEDRDRAICRHVMGVHMNSRQELFSGNTMGSGSNGACGGGSQVALSSGIVDDFGTSGVDLNNNATSPESIAENAMKVATSGGELNIPTMKKYVQYCKSRCSPRLSEEAGDVLASAYVKIRDDVRKASSSGGNNADADNQAVIPITVRQLEALVRISESLAKMRLEDEVHSEDITEALRLFRISTMAANAAGGGASSSSLDPSSQQQQQQGQNPNMPSHDDMFRAEQFLRSRLMVGTIVNKQRIMEEAAHQGYSFMVAAKAVSVMVMRGEILEKNQGRLLKRIK